MRGFIDFTVRLIQAGKRAYARKWNFLGVFAMVFLGSVFILGQFDLLPEMSPAPAASTVVLAADADVLVPVAVVDVVEMPMRIEIPAINVAATIANPTTTDIKVLDQKLLKGAVRYPTSALLGETGNVVLFGHSSYLPVVGNQAFKTFNGIQKLVVGDIVTVYASSTAYVYRVRSVAKESAKNAAIVLSVAGRVLTLATCNSFGAKEDRFVVTADFVESHSVSSQG